MPNIENDPIKEMIALEGYSYQLWEYHASHSMLTLRATHIKKRYHNVHINFISVFYIQMPMAWTADLRLASETEMRMVAEKIGMQLDDNAAFVSLFKAETSRGVIYILGTLANVEYNVEPMYK